VGQSPGWPLQDGDHPYTVGHERPHCQLAPSGAGATCQLAPFGTGATCQLAPATVVPPQFVPSGLPEPPTAPAAPTAEPTRSAEPSAVAATRSEASVTRRERMGDSIPTRCPNAPCVRFGHIPLLHLPRTPTESYLTSDREAFVTPVWGKLTQRLRDAVHRTGPFRQTDAYPTQLIDW